MFAPIYKLWNIFISNWREIFNKNNLIENVLVGINLNIKF